MRTAAISARWGAVLLVLGTAAVLLTARAEAAPAPTVSAVSPAAAPLVGGTAVTITGAGFDPGATVDFGGVAGTVTGATATSISVDAPAHAPGEVVVTVTNGDGQSATISGAFRFLGPPPTLTTVAPASGQTTGGTTITLTGTEFADGATVLIDGRAATSFNRTSATSATAVTPWGVAGAVDVEYRNADGQGVTLADAFTYTQAPAPTVTSVSPSSGTHGGGTQVTITGTGFGPGATVRFGSVAGTGVTVVSSTTVLATSPGGAAGSVSVSVTNADTQAGTRAAAFAYVDLPAPTVTGATPASGAQTGGTVVTITGTNFRPGATVNFGSVAGAVLSVTSTTITATAPAQPNATKVDVTVTNTDAKSAKLTGAFTYQKAPTVTKVTPPTGSALGGTTITISGTNFLAGMTVTVGGAAAADVKVTGASSATAVTPAGYAGGASVMVTNPDGQTGILTAGAFTYLAPPTINSISPGAGPDAGGTKVTLTGTGFGEGALVRVGDAEATDIVVLSSTSLTAVVPPGTGFVPLVVVAANGIESAETTFVYTSTAGKFSSGAIPTQGFGLVVFSGGTTSMLVAAAQAGGCTDVDHLSFFAADGTGSFVAYVASAPPFVNGEWIELFAEGIPASQPLVARCS